MFWERKKGYLKYLSAILFALILLWPSSIFAQNSTNQNQIVSVIILFKKPVTEQDQSLVQSVGGQITRTYHIINGLAATLPQDKIGVLKENSRVSSIDLDIPVYGFDLGADKQIRADKVWAKGDTGTGVPIA